MTVSEQALAACMPVGGSSYECSGINTLPQAISDADANVITIDGFSIDTTGTNATALDISGMGAITYTDINGSALTAGGIGLVVVSQGDIVAGSAGAVTIDASGVISGGTGGIEVENYGTGATNITAGGAVTTTSGSGIRAGNINAANASVVTINAQAVTGTTYGIFAHNFIGAIDITAAGPVTAGIGILASNPFAIATGAVTINAQTVSGAVHGILIENAGTGATSLTATGAVVGAAGIGIDVNTDNAANISGLAIDVHDVSGGTSGIEVENAGTGATSITATGAVVGTDGIGIYGSLTNTANTGGLAIDVHDVSGASYGIVAANDSIGDTSITASGTVTGTTEAGISVSHFQFGGSGGIVIDTQAVNGAFAGIFSGNAGPGSTSITAHGAVTATSGSGIYAMHGIPGSANALTIDAQAVTGTTYGIRAGSIGAGAVDIATAGPVTATIGVGIMAWNSYSSSTGAVTVAAQSVSGGTSGIEVENAGTGAISVAATDAVVGTDGIGIHVETDNAANLGGIAIDAQAVSGGMHGILAYNPGLGATRIDAQGTVTGTTGSGIFVRNHSTANLGGIGIEAAAVSGNVHGIYAENHGTGATTITATGDVTAIVDKGIAVGNDHVDNVHPVTIRARAVTGGDYGIYVNNSGRGAIDISAAGTVTATNGIGVVAWDRMAANSGGIAVETQAVNGATDGILVENVGTGATSITASGAVVGTDRFGILGVLTNGANANGIAVDVRDVSGGTDGIRVSNAGTGATSITASGAIVGTDGIGIYGVLSNNNTGGIAIDAQAVSGGMHGILAYDPGLGATRIEAQGTVTGTTGSGIFVRSDNTANLGGIAIEAGAVSGNVHGIYAENHGTGATTITATGDVTAIVDKGIAVGNDHSGNTNAITVDAQAVSGGNKGIFVNNQGLGAINVVAGGTVTATDGIGIDASNHTAANTGGISIRSQAVSGRQFGIWVDNRGIGATSVTTSGIVTGTEWRGIEVRNQNAINTGGIIIDAQTASGGVNGILVSNQGLGATKIAVSGYSDGIDGAGIFALNSNAANAAGISIDTQSASGLNGIFALNQGTGATYISAGGIVEGDIGIQAISTNGAAIDVVVNGEVRNSSRVSTDLAIVTTDGAASIVNNGRLVGIVTMDDFDDNLINAGVWTTSGVSEFGSGNDRILNQAGGTIVAASIANTPETTRFDNLETYSGDGTVSLVDGGGGDRLELAGNAVFEAGAILDYELGQVGSDLIVVTGDLTLDGRVDITDIGGFGPGVYRLINYGGALTDNGLDLGGLPAGIDASVLFIQTSVASQVNLISAAGATLSFWDGGDATLHDNGTAEAGDGVWNAANRNWTLADGAINGPWGNDFAIFGGSAGTVSVDNSGGAVSFGGMQFMTDGYLVAGEALTTQSAETIIRADSGVTATIAAGINGTGGLVKTDTGTLVLSGTNTYAGGTMINGGVLQVSADANLGAATGGLAFNGGTLAVTASFASARTAALAGAGGGFDVAAGASLGLAGTISGAGGLTKQGAGTLMLSGANSYSGGTTVSAGMLSVSADANLGAVESELSLNGGTLQSTAAFTTARSVTLDAGGGAFQTDADLAAIGAISGAGGLTKQGTGTLVLSGANSYAGGTAINGGTLQVSADANLGAASGGLSLDGGMLAATTSFNSARAVTLAGGGGVFDVAAATSLGLSGTISGAGGLSKIGNGTLVLTGTNSYSGTTTVAAGLLEVNGSIANSAVTVAGGRLGGTGTVGATTIASGGTLAPGNSVGTLNVTGDVSFAAGSIYEVEVDPGSAGSDLVHAAGQAVLNGGTAVHLGLASSYQPLTTYTIVTADGGVTGAFGGVSSSFAFLDPTLSYDADNVFLELVRNNIAFCGIGLTPNQCSAGEGVESLDFGNPLFDAVVVLDEAAARSAFNQLSGEVHASAKGMLLDESRFVRDAAAERIRAAFADVASTSMPVMAYGAGGAELIAADTDRFAVWGQAFGAWGSFDGDGNAAKFDHSGGGFLAGGDALVGETWRLGMLAGYSRSSFDVDDRSSSGDSDTIHLGLYGGTQWGSLGFRAGAAYSWHDIETARDVAFAGFADRLTASYDAGTAQVFGELGYKIETGNAIFEPFANLAYVDLSTDAFTEQGGAAALASAKTSTDATVTTLGVRATTGFMLGAMQAEARGMLGWRHAFGDVTPDSSFAFADGSPFAITGTPIARDALALEVGLDLDIAPNATVGISYSGQIAADAADHAAKANLTIRF